MSDKPKFPRADALRVAKELCDALEGTVEKLIIAGSLRRRKQFVGDVEVLFVPRLVEKKKEQAGLFGDFEQVEYESLAERKIEALLASGVIVKRPSKIGVFTWGKDNKLAVHAKSGIPVDFFATSLEKWFVSLVIRTGSAETNLKLTTGANKLGGTLHAYGTGVTHSDGTHTKATSEQHVFDLCGVPYAEPKDR